ncbi:MAG: DUF1634 domain-containing protein [Phycisphaerales bacterium]|jgi:uncharacterized membrane protein|nr:DUF1634 domain-containing protein [Phycisphaerales bacterium]
MNDHEISLSPTEQAHRVRQVELLISRLLRIGVLTSLCIIVLGMMLSFRHHSGYRESADELKHLVSNDAEFPHTLPQVWDGLMQLQGRAVVMVGLLALIATPVLRVAVSIFAFIYERDPKFVVITSLVLLLLLLSFFLGSVE